MKPFRLAICLSLAALSCLAQTPTSGSRPAASGPATRPTITIGYDTTRLTGPLRPNGTVDYIAAINENYSKGVTRDNNAAVAMFEALPPEVLEPDMRSFVYKEWGISATRPGPFLQTAYPEDQKFWDALSGPWSAKDHPELATWLRQNQASLNRFLAGLKRPRLYIPMMPTESIGLSSPLPKLSFLRGAAQMLLVRANLAIAEGRMDDARGDILSAFRLGSLARQLPTGVGRFVAVSVVQLGNSVIQHVVPSLDAKTARAMLAGLQAMPVDLSIAECMDTMERYSMLDFLAGAAVDPEQIRKKYPVAPAASKAPLEFPGIMSTMDRGFYWLGSRSADVDWDKVLCETNRTFDQTVAILKESNPALRRHMIADFTKQGEPARKRATSLPTDTASRDEKTRWVVDFVQVIATPVQIDTRTQAAVADWRLSMFALALVAWKGEKGSYPQTLSQLVPEYLKALPQDNFSGGDFLYRRQGNGYVLYSIGENGIDDGGRNWRRYRSDYAVAPKSDDIVIRVEK